MNLRQSFLPSLLTLLVCKSVGWPWSERRGCCKRLIIGCGDTLLYSMLRAGDRERGEFLGDCFGEGQGELRGDGENLLTAGCTVWCVPSSSSSKLCASSSWSLNVPRLVELQEEPELRREAVAAYSCRRPGNNENIVHFLPAHRQFKLETVHTNLHPMSNSHLAHLNSFLFEALNTRLVLKKKKVIYQLIMSWNN